MDFPENHSSLLEPHPVDLFRDFGPLAPSRIKEKQQMSNATSDLPRKVYVEISS